MGDTTSRDALARHLCARICDARRTHDDLKRVENALDTADGTLGEWLGEQQFDETAARTERDAGYRGGWNDAMEHVERRFAGASFLTPIERGLSELANAQPIARPRTFLEFDLTDFDDTGGEG
jgi:hypothetical protein